MVLPQVGRHQVRERLAQQLVRPVPEDAVGGRVREHDRVVLPDDEDGGGGVFGEGPELRLALAHLPLAAMALGGVGEGHHRAPHLVADDDGSRGVVGQEAGAVLPPEDLPRDQRPLAGRQHARHRAFRFGVGRSVRARVVHEGMHGPPQHLLRGEARACARRRS